MADFLTLCQDTWTECGLPSSLPVSVTGQKGTPKLIVKYVRDAWEEIQKMHTDWSFHLTDTVAQLDIGTRIYPLAHFASNISRLLALRYADDSGKIALEDWTLSTPITLTETGKPTIGYRREDDRIYMNKVADQEYPVQVLYRRTPQILAANADVPIMRAEYHQAIVWKAVEYYARFDTAPELLEKAQLQFGTIYRDMVLKLTPPITFAKSKFL